MFNLLISIRTGSKARYLVQCSYPNEVGIIIIISVQMSVE